MYTIWSVFPEKRLNAGFSFSSLPKALAVPGAGQGLGVYYRRTLCDFWRLGALILVPSRPLGPRGALGPYPLTILGLRHVPSKPVGPRAGLILAPSGLLRAAGRPLTLLGAPGLLSAPVRSWALLGAPGPSCALLGAPGRSCAPVRSWALLGAPGRSWALLALLGVPGRFCALLRAPFRTLERNAITTFPNRIASQECVRDKRF